METKEINRLNAKQRFAICKILEDGAARFEGVPVSTITREIQPLLDFEVNRTNVSYLCKQLGIKATPKKKTEAPNNNAVLLEIVGLVEIVVEAIERDDLFSGDMTPAREKIRQIKKTLS